MGIDYMTKVRTRDPETSWDAAARQTRAKTDRVKAAILTLLAQHGPLTDEQIYDRYEALAWMDRDVPRVTAQCVRTRRNELRLALRVRDTGRRAATRSGSTGTLWEVDDRFVK